MQKENIVEINKRANRVIPGYKKIKKVETSSLPDSNEKEVTYYAELSKARDIGELKRKLDACIERIGFSEYSFTRLDSIWQGAMKEFTTISSDLLDSYFAYGFYEQDMSINYFVNNTKAIYRSVFDTFVNQATFEIDMFKTMREIRKLNTYYAYYDYYNTLAKAANGKGHVMLVVAGKGLSPSDLRVKVRGHEDSLQMLCEAFDFVITHKFSKLLGGSKDTEIVRLSPRPLKILTTFANNDFNVGQLAKKMGISYVTANKHLEAARKAFGVKNNHAAVKQAVKQGLIRYD